MKRVFVVCFTTILMTLIVGLAPARAASHSGPEALAKGTGAVSSTDNQYQPITRELCHIVTNTCSGPWQVATQITTTETEESFDFSAKLGPKSSTLDPTSGAFGSMKLTYKSTVTTNVVEDFYYQFCNPSPGFYAPQGCPALGPTALLRQAGHGDR